MIVNLHKLPKGWRSVRIGDVFKLINGKAFKPSDWSKEGLKIIRIQNLNDETKPFNHWAGALDKQVVINSGDVLLAWSGTPGTSFGAHLWNRGKGVLNQHIYKLEFDKNKILTSWAVWAVNEQLENMISKAHGAAGLRHITKRETENLSILLPPLPEQKRIAAILNERMASIDKARAAAGAQLEAAKALPAAYLREVFNSPEAQKWPKKRLEEVCQLLPAKSISTSGDTEVKVITTACLTERGFKPSGLKIARMWATDAAKCVVSQGEVLVARSNTPELVGRVSMFPGNPEEIVASDLTIRIMPGPSLEPAFFASYLSFPYRSGYWKEKAGGASGSMKKIRRSQIREKHIPLPILSEQKRVVEIITTQMRGVDILIQELEKQLETIHKLPAALLRQAFRGEL